MSREIFLSKDAYLVLMIFCLSDIGLTKSTFLEQAAAAEVKEPLKVFDELQSMGLVKVQDRSKEGREDCLKATTKAFSTVIRSE